jgi:hypothetical protein
MAKILSLALFLLVACGAFGQVMAHVDKKTRAFTVSSDLKIEYTVFGYEYANNTTRRMICFSSNVNVVRGSTCPLGSYFDTDKMKPGDKIIYLSGVGTFGKMNFISGTGKKTVFYLPKSSFTIK